MLKVGFIGFGKRGKMMLNSALDGNYGIEIVAVCDLYADRAEEGAKIVEAKTGKLPFYTTSEDEFFGRELDAIVVTTAWEAHIPVTIKAMKKGIPVGMEVGGAYSIHDCFKLVDTYEETHTPVMLLENCCYGQKELAVLKMVREGLFGEVVHCSGGYHHALRDEVANGIESRHYRLRNYISRNCENYPTHELGPIAMVLNINRGNRMMTLTSTASKARGLSEYIKARADKYPHLQDTVFNQGDIVTTVITCANGETITLTLDTTLPRSYSRGFTVRGTKAAYFEDTDSFFFDNNAEHHAADFDWSKQWGNGKNYREEAPHPIWVKHGQAAKDAGHDGMDYMVLAAFFESVHKGVEPPIDVYDTAAWMAITPLSEESIKLGGAPVAIPDFTRGLWAMPREKCTLEFSLD